MLMCRNVLYDTPICRRQYGHRLSIYEEGFGELPLDDFTGRASRFIRHPRLRILRTAPPHFNRYTI